MNVLAYIKETKKVYHQNAMLESWLDPVGNMNDTLKANGEICMWTIYQVILNSY